MFSIKLLNKLFSRDAAADAAQGLYAAAVAGARAPEYYRALGVPDTVEGRFEMITLHVYLILRRLKDGDAAAGRVAQALFDTMFADMDRNLREMGVGDLGVGRRVKAMAQALYGRMHAYDEALAQGEEALARALARNVFAAENADAAALALARYVIGCIDELGRRPVAGLVAGDASFPAVSALGGGFAR